MKANISSQKKLNILIVVSVDMERKDGASSIRPRKMIKAFMETSHNIDIITSPNRVQQRRNIYKRVLISSLLNKHYDICYYEPSTYPIHKTERLLIKWLKWRKIWISYFHRDMYWRYEIGTGSFSEAAFKKHCFEQESNLTFLERYIDQLFVPTESYAKNLKSTLPTTALPPAGGSIEITYDPALRKGIIYVGGLSKLYGVELLLASMALINKSVDIPLVIICREKDLRSTSETFSNYSNSKWLAIFHEKHDQLESYYRTMKVAILPKEKSEYNDLSMSYKLFEYASHGLPIAVSDNSEQVSFVEDNHIGINIGDTVESFANNLMQMYLNNEQLMTMHINSTKFIKEKGLWKHRAQRVINTYWNSYEKE